ncbi:hypothetical protein NCS52_01560200 [Fusarium sp. LHS14.1]|nr:hypothetical protein NCS52_01560200 [Fusarium sp. LHS14.1]
MKGFTIQSLDCWPCRDRPNNPLKSTLAYLILTYLSHNDIGLKKLVLMRSKCNNAPSLERLADLFPSQLASVEDLCLSLGQSSSFEYPPSSLQFSADFFKNLRTLHSETDIFPATVIWNHVTTMSLRMQHADGLEEFLDRHPGLKKLSLILDPTPPLDEFWKACMTGLLKLYLASNVAESIIWPAYLEASAGGKSTYFFTCVLSRVGQRIGHDADMYKEIHDRIDRRLATTRNVLAVISGEKLSGILGKRRIQSDVKVVQWEIFDFRS